MRALFPLGVLVRAAVIFCIFMVLRASMWAAFVPAHHSLFPVLLWSGVAFAWAALLPAIKRHEVTA
ncbi:hypothetical protein [Deinococcus altitudinis]|uniref:hypothetical protein n=1 Tax=Deinococcus altitudinis TaxID=468914 RepID=UPI0038913BD4